MNDNNNGPQLLEPIGVLMLVLRHHSDKGRRKPEMFPGTVREAAQYWIDHQEPGDDYREAVKVIRENDKVLGYETPYHDRLRRNLLKFLKMKRHEQVMVIDAVERGIAWRGDDIKPFQGFVEEAEIMALDPQAYIERGQALLRAYR